MSIPVSSYQIDGIGTLNKHDVDLMDMEIPEVKRDDYFNHFSMVEYFFMI